MLRASVIRSCRPLGGHASSSTLLLRSFTSASRTAVSPTAKADASKGVEGPHPKDETLRLPLDGTAPQHFKGATDGTSPMRHGEMPIGDWVMSHPVYTKDEVNSVQIVQRQAKTMSDKLAQLGVRTLRTSFDLLTGYRHKTLTPDKASLSLEEMRKQGYAMTPQQWLLRFLFLETVAGVPGMVAGTLRHLRSLRLMRRDGGWIHTLLEESENERMHLMTFLAVKKPTILFRALVLGAQGVFYNAFFFGYLFSPKTAHRFVGYLEEEAVKTYTLAVDDLEKGRIPEWTDMPAPEIAIDYWRMSKDAKFIDVLRNIRADEATHRFVNHSLANLNQREDANPFALREPDMVMKGSSPGLERSEAAQFMSKTQKMLGEEEPSAAPLEKASV